MKGKSTRLLVFFVPDILELVYRDSFPFPQCTLTVFMGFVDISVSRALNRCRCHIDAKDNHPRLNRVYPLNLSRIVDVLTSTMTIPLRLQESLRVSITSGSFVDTKFWVFSKRGSTSERIGEPKALFVNAHIVKRVPRLGSCAIASSICLKPLN